MRLKNIQIVCVNGPNTLEAVGIFTAIFRYEVTDLRTGQLGFDSR